MKTLVLGTGNPGKIVELKELLVSTKCKIVDLGELPAVEEPEETGSTFSENACIKASYYAEALGRNVLADDSGLEVISLGGRPGVFSSRFAGKNANDAQNNEKLLKELEGTDSPRRAARFVCAMALADSTGRIIFRSSGHCSGTIARKPRGFNGFGYDPLFVPDEFEKSFAELPESIKKSIGHRAKASIKIVTFLRFNSSLLT